MRTKPTPIDYDALPPKEQRDAAFYETFGGHVFYCRLAGDPLNCPAPKRSCAQIARQCRVELVDLADALIQYRGNVDLAALHALNRKNDRLLQITLQAALGDTLTVPLPDGGPLWTAVNEVSAARERIRRQLGYFAAHNSPGSGQRLTLTAGQLLSLAAVIDPARALLTDEEQAALDALLRLAEEGATALTGPQRTAVAGRFFPGEEGAALLAQQGSGRLTLTVSGGIALYKLTERRMAPVQLTEALLRLHPELTAP